MANPFKKPAAPAPAPAPEPAAPAPMPDTSSAAAIEAKRRSQIDLMRRGGRASTILTAPDRRSRDTYTAPNLG